MYRHTSKIPVIVSPYISRAQLPSSVQWKGTISKPRENITLLCLLDLVLNITCLVIEACQSCCTSCKRTKVFYYIHDHLHQHSEIVHCSVASKHNVDQKRRCLLLLDWRERRCIVHADIKTCCQPTASASNSVALGHCDESGGYEAQYWG